MSVPTILVVNLSAPPYVECAACGDEVPSEQGLPVDTSGDFVDNDYDGEWGGVPACRRCYDVHAAGGAAALEAMLAHLRR